jgi:DNA-binding SARP family transcriptional activator
VLLERERFRQLRLHALERLCDRLTAQGRFAEATEAGLAAVAGEPLRESAHRALIRAYLAEGNPGEAVGQYERLRALLRDELGVSPSPLVDRMLADLL